MSENDNVNQPIESGTTAPPEVPRVNPEPSPPPQEDKVTIPSDVEELLEQFSSANPAGIDIATTEMSDAISLSMDLEGEMEKRRDNDYPGCVKWGKALLSQHSKDLKIAALLSIAWFRTEGLSGLNKGLILLAELLTRFGEKCFPQGKAKQVRIFSALNNDPRLQTLKKISFEAEKPVFKVTAEILEGAAAKELPREILFKITKFKDKSIVGDTQFITELKNELFPKDAKKIELIEKNKDKLLQVFKESKTAEIQTQFSITDRFMKIVASIAEIDKHRDIFLELKDEKYLSAERFSDELKQRFKDNGVALNVVEPFQPLFDCLGNNNIAYLLDLKSGYEQLLKTVKAYFDEEQPELSNLSDLIGKPTQIAEKLVDETIKNILENRKKTEPKPVPALEPAPGPEPGPKSEPGPEPGPRPAAAVKPVVGPKPTPTPAGEVSVQNLVIKRDTEAISVIKKAISYYFVEEKSIPTPDNKIKKEKVFKVPSDPRIYGISRAFKWNHIKGAPDNDALTGPNEAKQKYLANTLNAGDFDTVITDFETNFIDNEDLLFWLDGQRYVVKSLEGKGGEWKLCAHEIKFQLAKLLQRLPGLPKLIFREPPTPFASPETQSWIEDEVMGLLGSGKVKEKILPPIMGEDYEPLNKEYENACNSLPENFEVNVKSMQQAITGDLRLKGKFLRKLNLANYCSLAKHYDFARVLFDELISEIEKYHILEWEQALCVAVWQAIYLNNLKLMVPAQPDQKSALEIENKALINKISKYDIVLALNLTK